MHNSYYSAVIPVVFITMHMPIMCTVFIHLNLSNYVCSCDVSKYNECCRIFQLQLCQSSYDFLHCAPVVIRLLITAVFRSVRPVISLTSKGRLAPLSPQSQYGDLHQWKSHLLHWQYILQECLVAITCLHKLLQLCGYCSLLQTLKTSMIQLEAATCNSM